METVLDTAHSWFLEACTQLPSGEFHIRLAEGVKGTNRLPVKVGEKTLSPYFPVRIEATSRVVELQYNFALVLFAFNESYDTKDSELIAEAKTILRRVGDSSFRNYIFKSTTVIQLGVEPLTEGILWTENQISQVFAFGDPQVVEISEAPDLSIERYRTWSAS